MLSYSIACILGSIAKEKAVSIGVPMAIAIVDNGGHLIYFCKMDRTLPASTDLAISKAYTAATLRMETSELGKLAQPGEVLYGIQHALDGKVVLFGGGLPLYLDEEVVGGIGISGGSVEEDILVAKPVTEALAAMEQLSKQFLGIPSDRILSMFGMHQFHNELRRTLCSIEPALTSVEIDIVVGAALMALDS